MMRMPYCLICVALCSALAADPPAAPAQGKHPQVQVHGPRQERIVAQSRFERKNTPAGAVYLYYLTLKGTQAEFEGQLPDVDGLILKFKRTERSFKNINGKFQSEVTFVYLAHRLEDKDFLLPAFEVEVDGETVAVPQARLLASGYEEEKEAARTVWMELSPEHKKLYVGQVLPFEVRLYRRGDIGLSANLAGPELKNEGFSLPVYEGRYQESETRIQGVGFSVYAWKGAMTALKSGSHALRLDFPVVATLPGGRQDPFDLFMGLGGGEKHDLILQTQPQDLAVEPLPEAGRPDSFSGAVGDFRLDASLEAQELSIGEPVTLKLAISGRGALDQLVAPELKLGGGWKLYAPRSELRTTDPTHAQGTALFEYILVPLDASIKALPELKWAFFNPYEERYEELSVPAKPLTVKAPVDVPSVAPSGRTPSAAPEDPFEAPADPTPSEFGPSLLPLHLGLGPQADSLRPLVLRPGFWALQGGLLVVWALVYAWLKRHRYLLQNPQLLRKRQRSAALRQHEKELDTALKEQDAQRFFALACQVLREAVSLRTDQPPEALTREDILKHAVALRLNSEQQGIIKLCFEQADGAKYGAAAHPMHYNLKLCYDHLKTLTAAFVA